MNQIEKLFYDSFFDYAKLNHELKTEYYEFKTEVGVNGDSVKVSITWDGCDCPHEGNITLHPQRRLGPYTVDFQIGGKIRDDYIFLLVEIDGHEFHEKTKKQAAHDRKRDRYLAFLGYSVLRFTGSEIFNDPSMCIEEVFTCIVNRYCCT